MIRSALASRDRSTSDRGTTAPRPTLRASASRCLTVALLVLGTLQASTALAQTAKLTPERVLLNGDPPPTGVFFGTWLASSGPYVLVTGIEPSGAVTYQGWTQGDGPEWTSFFTQTLFSNAFSMTAPVGIADSTAYRHSDNLGTGFSLGRLDLSQLGTSVSWSHVWDPDDSNALLRALDAGSSNFVSGRLVGLAWISGSNTHFAVLVDQDAGATEVYSDSIVGITQPSVSVDFDQVAVGLPSNQQVVTVTSGAPWTQESVINGPISANSFGAAVALYDDQLAVSAPDSSICVIPPDIGCVNSGQVWVYTRVGSVWTFATPLFSSFEVESGESIGRSLRFSDNGDRLAVGALGSSKVYLFARDAMGNWDRVAEGASSPAQDDSAGYSVDFAGNGDLFAGAPYYDDGSGQVGAALMFREAIFSDGFDFGTTNAWSSSSP